MFPQVEKMFEKKKEMFFITKEAKINFVSIGEVLERVNSKIKRLMSH